MASTTTEIEKPQRARLVDKAQRDPAWWVREVLGDHAYGLQVQILESIRDNEETAVKGCHGLGKDWIAARAALWFLYAHKPSIVITTGPTDRQVRGILWKEIGVAHARSRFPLGGVPLQQELKLARDWWAWGFTAPHKDPTRFQGFHEENVLVIIDEAAGVSPEIYTAIEGVLSSDHARKLEIGNPTDPMSSFADSFKTPGVAKMTISAFDTPNFVETGITQDDIANDTWRDKLEGRTLPMRKLVTPAWVAKRYQRWGPDSPLYQSRVLAQFPTDAPDTLIPLAWIEEAHRKDAHADPAKMKHNRGEDGKPKPPVWHQLGVDVARFGDDKCAIYEAKGARVRRIDLFGKSSTMQTVGRVIKAFRLTGAKSIAVDVVGVGAGVVDRLKEQGLPVVEANAGGKPPEPDRFANNRAAWFWNIRELAERRELDLDSRDDDVTAQLASLRWKADSRGRIVLEKKDDMKRRGLPSPDCADAVAIALANHETRPALVMY